MTDLFDLMSDKDKAMRDGFTQMYLDEAQYSPESVFEDGTYFDFYPPKVRDLGNPYTRMIKFDGEAA